MNLPSSTVPIIAPLWADFDFRDTGVIYYRVSQDMNLLSYANTIFSDVNPSLSVFQPKLCIVVTWLSASLFSRDFIETPVSGGLLG